MQTDPIGYEDQYNLYAYVGNDPANTIDPSGEAEANTCSRAGGTSCSGSYEAGGSPGSAASRFAALEPGVQSKVRGLAQERGIDLSNYGISSAEGFGGGGSSGEWNTRTGEVGTSISGRLRVIYGYDGLLPGGEQKNFSQDQLDFLNAEIRKDSSADIKQSDPFHSIAHFRLVRLEAVRNGTISRTGFDGSFKILEAVADINFNGRSYSGKISYIIDRDGKLTHAGFMRGARTINGTIR